MLLRGSKLEMTSKLLSSLSSSPGGQTSPSADVSRQTDLHKTIQSLQEAAEQREKQLEELSSSLEEAQMKQCALQVEKDEAQEENAGLLQNYTRLQASVDELQTRVQEQEGKALQKAQLEHDIQVLKQNLKGMTVFILILLNILSEKLLY